MDLPARASCGHEGARIRRRAHTPTGTRERRQLFMMLLSRSSPLGLTQHPEAANNTATTASTIASFLMITSRGNLIPCCFFCNDIPS